jgi:hypothetical protein
MKISDVRKIYPDAIAVHYSFWRNSNFAICAGIPNFEKYLRDVFIFSSRDYSVYKGMLRLSEWSENADSAWQSAFERIDRELINRLSE